jgi:hypothetical protein
MSNNWYDRVFSIEKIGFERLALDIFRLQYETNRVYNSYVNTLDIRSSSVDSIEKIPFLPISLFKTDEIKTGKFNTEIIFESSGTTQTAKSRHHVKDASLYVESSTRGFESFYGKVNEWCIIGLLPSYLEKENSSLVFMVDNLIKKSHHSQSGFYLYDFKKLNETLVALESLKQKTLLIGVTFALLDFAEKFPMSLTHTIIMETGGMKGRREELTRMEVHERLKKAFNKNDRTSHTGLCKKGRAISMSLMDEGDD